MSNATASRQAGMSPYAKMFNDIIECGPGCTLDNFVPHPDYIVVRQLPPDEMSKNGILYPENVQSPKEMAVVLKLPDNTDRFPFPVKVGDVVWFRNTVGTIINMADDVEVQLLRFCGKDDDDVFGVFRK